MYTRFFRWASDRVKDEGVIALVTGRKPFAKAAYDGFRKVVSREFTEIWIMDLGGDVRDNPRISGTKHNVFGIQTGVAISFLVKRKGKSDAVIRYARRPETEIAADKLAWLHGRTLEDAQMREIVADRKHDWLNQADKNWDLMPSLATKNRGESGIFVLNTNGVQSKRDDWNYDWDSEALHAKAKELAAAYERALAENDLLSTPIKWDADLVRHLQKKIPKPFRPRLIVRSLYRPFTWKWLYFDPAFNSRVFKLPQVFSGFGRNSLIAVGSFKRSGFGVIATDLVPTTDLFLPDVASCFPRYRYDGADRFDNITDWALTKFSAKYEQRAYQDSITKEAIFHYVYAVLHDPEYREKYALNLKREFPRIPFYPDFWRWSRWGEKLMDLHIGYETVDPWPLVRTDEPDEKARKAGLAPKALLKPDREAGTIRLDTETTLSGVPAEAWTYRLGNRSALDWVLDQHKEKTPKDPTVREKFNTYRFADHKEKVIDLLTRVTRVSIETMKIVEAMKSAKHT
jgi:predicted helicase